MSVVFPFFHRFNAIVIDGQAVGYIADEAPKGEPPRFVVHLAKHAAAWLKAIRHAGPYDDIEKAKGYIREGAGQGSLLPENVIELRPRT